LGTHKDDFGPFWGRFLSSLQSPAQRLHHHHHTRPAAIRPIVDGSMPIFGKISGIKQLKGQSARRQSPPEHTVVGHGVEHVR
jgi:hypothetical protein